MSPSFKYFKQTSNSKDLILFVHGFTGSHSTWINSKSISFADLLLKDDYINNRFDVASYEYFTKLTDLFSTTSSTFKQLKSIFFGGSVKTKRNLDIEELSNNLRTEFRFTLDQYENVYVIAHSMGGLLTKSLIVNDLKGTGSTKIKLFISLAVPHLGASYATLGNMISSNLQIENLNSVSSYIGTLNEAWLKLDGKPTTKYFYGSYDDVVTKTSAVSIENDEKDVISVTENHLSISKPEEVDSVVVIALIQFIKEQYSVNQLGDIGYKKLESNEQFEDELFIIKLIVAEIESDTRQNIKELFLNAEYSRKILKSKYDMRKLDDLFQNIYQLYRDSYDEYLHCASKNSGLLLAEVHKKITDEDSKLLKSLIPTLKVFHKKGMLHQMANSEHYDIWWSKEKSLQGKGKQGEV